MCSVVLKQRIVLYLVATMFSTSQTYHILQLQISSQRRFPVNITRTYHIDVQLPSLCNIMCMIHVMKTQTTNIY